MRRWCNWLCELKKKDEEKRKEVEHQKLVSCMIKSAEGGTGLLHKITEPASWRGGVQMLERDDEDVELLARWEEKKEREWTNHWQCGTEG